MEDNFVTLAIHTDDKAQTLKRVLESEGIEVQFQAVDSESKGVAPGVRVRIKESNLPRALNVVENHQLFRYDDEETIKRDDGRPRILVPVDFSKYSLQACELAFNLAKDMDAKVKILNVYFNPYYPTALPIAEAFAYQGKENKEFQTIITKVKDNIQKLCNEIDERIAEGKFPSVNYSYVLREGLPEEEIVNFTKEYKPTVMIMGTRGKDQKDADLIGSVTAEVIEMSRVPLIAVPENTPFTNFKAVKKIGFLTNFSQRDLVSFDKMADLISRYPNVEINITHVNLEKRARTHWDDEKLEAVKKYFTKQYPENKFTFSVLDTDDLVSALNKHLKDNNIDMLGLTTSRRNIFARMFNPSISRRMLFHSDTPLLVLRG